MRQWERSTSRRLSGFGLDVEIVDLPGRFAWELDLYAVLKTATATEQFYSFEKFTLGHVCPPIRC